jgi:hypothetical protein
MNRVPENKVGNNKVDKPSDNPSLRVNISKCAKAKFMKTKDDP